MGMDGRVGKGRGIQETDAGNEALKTGKRRCEQRLVNFACPRYEMKGVRRDRSYLDFAMQRLMGNVRECIDS